MDFSAHRFNVNVNKTNNKNNVNVNNVRDIAQKLSDTLNDPKSFRYFCMVAWNLPEAIIWSSLEQAQTGREPRKLFSFLCNLELRKKESLEEVAKLRG